LDVDKYTYIVPRTALLINFDILADIIKMVHLNCLLPLFLSLLLCAACGNEDPDDLSSYYFPYEKYTAGKVLEYHPAKIPELGIEFWYVKSFSEGDKKFLVIQLFNESFQLQQYVREEYLPSGIKGRDRRLFRTSQDSTALIDINIVQDNVFPAVFQDSFTIYIYELQWVDPIDSMEYKLLRNRRLTHREDRMFLRKIRPAWKAKTLEEVETIEVGSTTSSWSGSEWFAKDIGLVYFKKQITDEFAREYYLREIHDTESFLENNKNALDQLVN
jgi:hypothetical protein